MGPQRTRVVTNGALVAFGIEGQAVPGLSTTLAEEGEPGRRRSVGRHCPPGHAHAAAAELRMATVVAAGRSVAHPVELRKQAKLTRANAEPVPSQLHSRPTGPAHHQVETPFGCATAGN